MESDERGHDDVGQADELDRFRGRLGGPFSRAVPLQSFLPILKFEDSSLHSLHNSAAKAKRNQTNALEAARGKRESDRSRQGCEFKAENRHDLFRAPISTPSPGFPPSHSSFSAVPIPPRLHLSHRRWTRARRPCSPIRRRRLQRRRKWRTGSGKSASRASNSRRS